MKALALFVTFFMSQCLFAQQSNVTTVFNIKPVKFNKEIQFEAVYYIAERDCSQSLKDDGFLRRQIQGNGHSIKEILILGEALPGINTREILVVFDKIGIDGEGGENVGYKFFCEKKSSDEIATDTDPNIKGSHSDGKEASEPGAP